MVVLARIRKAIVGGVATGGAVYASLTASGVKIDPLIEIGAALGAAIVGGVVVWLTPNAPPA